MEQHVKRQTGEPEPGTRATTDHEFIRQWIAERSGTPALVRRTGQENEGSVVINFPNDGSDEPIVDISWSDFFQRFEDQSLAFVYRESETGALEDRFYRLVERGATDMKGE